MRRQARQYRTERLLLRKWLPTLGTGSTERASPILLAPSWHEPPSRLQLASCRQILDTVRGAYRNGLNSERGIDPAHRRKH